MKVIDVRTVDEYQAMGNSDHINIPLDSLGQEISRYSIQVDEPIVVVCRSGARSGMAVMILHALGYTHVTNGGAWDSLG